MALAVMWSRKCAPLCAELTSGTLKVTAAGKNVTSSPVTWHFASFRGQENVGFEEKSKPYAWEALEMASSVSACTSRAW